MIVRLEEYDCRLEGLYIIYGVGLSSNIYVYGGKNFLMVDAGAGDEANRVSPKIKAIGLDLSNIAAVFLTHSHLDHAGGLREIVEEADPLIYVHVKDVKPVLRIFPRSVNLIGLKGSETIKLEGKPISIIHTPGHTAGSICLYIKQDIKALFSGDTVFSEGFFGRVDLPTGSVKDMFKSLMKLSSLDIEFLFPGHGKPALSSGLEHVKKALIGCSQMLNYRF